MNQTLVKQRKIIISSAILMILIISSEFCDNIAGKMIIYGNEITCKNFVEIIIWLLVAYLVTLIINIVIWDGLSKQNNTKVPGLLKSAVNAVIFLLAIIVITSGILHKSIATLLATTGAIGLLIGFSLRNVIDNLVQGISLNLQQIFKPGDIISIPGKFDQLAEVKDITMINTYLEDFVGNIIAIPNNVVSANLIRNYSHPQNNIFSIYFNITIGSSGLTATETMLILTAVMESTDFVVSYPKYHILIAKVSPTQIKYNISCWAARNKVNPLQAKHLLYSKIIEYLASASFDIGSPDDNPNIDQEYLASKEAAKKQRSLSVLKRIALFRHLDLKEIINLSKQNTVVYFKAGETIISQGESGKLFYILVEGVLQVYINGLNDNNLVPVTQLTPGNYFGEKSLVSGNTHTVTVIAISDAMIYTFPHEIILELLRNHPDIFTKISNKSHEEEQLHHQKAEQFYNKNAANNTKKSNFLQRLRLFITTKKTL
jgi:small-conductance mechanosensitive channel/CRP-like cAMP-binding protein